MRDKNSKNGLLYAKYKDAVHKGNSRGRSDLDAIRRYLTDSGFNNCEISYIKLLEEYKTTIAIKGVHYN